MMPSLSDTAAFFDCSERTIERYIRDNYGLDFREFRDRYMVHTRLDLRRAAIEKAKSGDNTMLIWCQKNIDNWSDTKSESKPLEIRLSYNLDDSEKEAA